MALIDAWSLKKGDLDTMETARPLSSETHIFNTGLTHPSHIA